MEENKEATEIEESVEKTPSDSLTDHHRQADEEINTFDAIPIRSLSENKGRGKTFAKSLYSFAAFLTVFLTVIFASAEVGDFIINDMGTGNFIMKRIFGNSISGSYGKNLCDIIIENMFIIPDKSTNVRPVPSPGDSENDTEANTDTNVPNKTETLPSIKEEDTKPPKDEPPPSTDITDEENKKPIIQMDMSLLSYGKSYIYNNTDLSPDVKTLSSLPLKKYYSSEAPLVLVIHTHGTESYMPEGSNFYFEAEEIARSHDPNQNMIAVGKEFVAVLEACGVPTLHCEIMHDKESYRESYDRAAQTIEKYLSEYPSIKYVFDLHRDSVMKSSGELVSAVTSIDGAEYAQIMAVIGSGFDGWENNLSFALQLREGLNSKYINLCRPVCLRASTYNQYMSAVSLILEIGTSGNDLTEAKNSARLAAEAISSMILP